MHQQCAGARQPKTRASIPRGAGVPIEEVPHPACLGAVFAEMVEGWASEAQVHRGFDREGIWEERGRSGGFLHGGDAKEHAKRIIELVVEDNPTGRKAA